MEKTMKTNTKQIIPKDTVALTKQRSYNEIIEFLDANWKSNLADKNLSVMKKLDQAFGTPSQKLNTILVAGTN